MQNTIRKYNVQFKLAIILYDEIQKLKEQKKKHKPFPDGNPFKTIFLIGAESPNSVVHAPNILSF